LSTYPKITIKENQKRKERRANYWFEGPIELRPSSHLGRITIKTNQKK